MRSPVILAPHFPVTKFTIAVSVIFPKEIIDLRINVKWSEAAIFVEFIVVGKEIVSRDHFVTL